MVFEVGGDEFHGNDNPFLETKEFGVSLTESDELWMLP